jgi:hypothetical protein
MHPLKQYGYWWVEAMLGVALILAPFAEHLPRRSTPTLTDVIAGIVLVGWAMFGAWQFGDEPSREPARTGGDSG